MRGERFPKQLRLLKSSEFDRVFAARCQAADGRLRLYGTANGRGHPRLGLTVSRKVGGAVARNRWKRALREAFRLTQHRLPPLDLVCIPRGRQPPELSRLIESLAALAARLQKKQRPPRAPAPRAEPPAPPPPEATP